MFISTNKFIFLLQEFIHYNYLKFVFAGLIAKSGSESSLSGGEVEDKDKEKKRKEPDCQPEEKEKCSGDEQNGDSKQNNTSGDELNNRLNAGADEVNSKSNNGNEVQTRHTVSGDENTKHSTSGDEPADPPQPVVRRRRSSAKNPLVIKYHFRFINSLLFFP